MLVTFDVSDGCVQMYKLLCVEDSVALTLEILFTCVIVTCYQYRHNVCIV